MVGAVGIYTERDPDSVRAADVLEGDGPLDGLTVEVAALFER